MNEKPLPKNFCPIASITVWVLIRKRGDQRWMNIWKMANMKLTQWYLFEGVWLAFFCSTSLCLICYSLQFCVFMEGSCVWVCMSPHRCFLCSFFGFSFTVVGFLLSLSKFVCVHFISYLFVSLFVACRLSNERQQERA